MEVLSDIPLKFGLKKILKHFKVNTNTQARKIIKDFMDLSTNLISPKAAYKVAYVENKTNATVKVEKVQFKSKILRENLNKLERVFPYIITIGENLENKAALMKDLLKQYYLEEIGDLALHSISEYLEKYLKKKYKLGQISKMSPGSLKDWPITQQDELFSLFGNTQKIIGVSLTDSFLMIPRKSISGIYFPTEIKFYSCQLCPREGCIGRKAPYDPKLAKTTGNG